MDKSNIIVFRNGGALSAREKWKLNGVCMQVVNVYKYLGIYMSTRLSHTHTLNDMAVRAKKAVVCTLKLLWSLGERSPSIFFKLFDAQIQPMLNYGAEVWGLNADLRIIEKVHLFALKRFLTVSIRTPTDLVYGETGRYPLSVNVKLKCVKYWLRIIKLPCDRLPFKAYKMLLGMLDQNRNSWASSMCFLLHSHGCDDAWINQGVGDEKAFLGCLRERLIDNFKQEWSDKINQRSNDRYSLYSKLSVELKLSSYLVDVKYMQAKGYISRFRLGVSQINIHYNRFKRNPVFSDFACPFCHDVLETEIHFIFCCPIYNDLREHYIEFKYYSRPSMFRLAVLLSSNSKSIMSNLGYFLYKACERRKLLLLT